MWKEGESEAVRNDQRSLQNQYTFQGQDCPIHDLEGASFTMTTMEEAVDNLMDEAYCHDFYSLLFFTDVRSKQVLCVDKQKIMIVENLVFLLRPGQMHTLEQQNLCGFVMNFSKDFFEKHIGNDILKLIDCSENFSVIIPDSWFEVFHSLLDLIRKEYGGARRLTIIESYLRSLMLHCMELKKQSRASADISPRLHTLIELVEVHYRKQRRADFYAGQLSMSAKRLNELTRSAFGKTISQLINDRLVLEAKREIGKIEKPIKEICYDLGFSEPAYFTRFFGKQTGYTPQDFRKRIASMEM